MASNEKNNLKGGTIFYGIPSENNVKRNIDKWINEAGEPDLFVEKDENLCIYKNKFLDKYDVVSFKEAMERFPNADVWVTWRKAEKTRKMLSAVLPAEKLHFLEDRSADSAYHVIGTRLDTTGISNITPAFLSMIKLLDEKCKKLNYLLVMPVMPRLDQFAFTFQTGIASVSSALKASGRKLFNLNLDLNSSGNPYDLLKNEIIKHKIDVVMTGGVNSQFKSLKQILDTAKEADPNIITVVGGVIVTADPTAAMEAFENADYGVIGEGEITINALAYALETNNYMPDIDGVVFRRNDQWVARVKYPSVPDLSILPYPDYAGFEYSQYLENATGKDKRAFLTTSRSCIYRCTFCFSKHGKYRRLSIDDVFKLIDWVLSLYPSVRRLHLGDEISFSEPEYAIEFSRRIKPYKLNWICTLRADRVTKEMLVAMKDSGCKGTLIGIESADNSILKSMRKGFTIEQLEKGISIANEVGLRMVGFLLFGDLEETMDTALCSINWYIKHKKNVSGLTMIRIDPGSRLYEIACERDLISNRAEYIRNYKLSGSRLINLSKLTESEFIMLPHLLKIMEALQLQ